MGWLNLIWIIPIALFYGMILMIKLWQSSNYRKVRKIMAQLYGEIVNDCVLCPVCEGYVYIGAWEEHTTKWPGKHYRGHYIEPIADEFKKASEKLLNKN